MTKCIFEQKSLNDEFSLTQTSLHSVSKVSRTLRRQIFSHLHFENVEMQIATFVSIFHQRSDNYILLHIYGDIFSKLLRNEFGVQTLTRIYLRELQSPEI